MIRFRRELGEVDFGEAHQALICARRELKSADQVLHRDDRGEVDTFDSGVEFFLDGANKLYECEGVKTKIL